MLIVSLFSKSKTPLCNHQHMAPLYPSSQKSSLTKAAFAAMQGNSKQLCQQKAVVTRL